MATIPRKRREVTEIQEIHERLNTYFLRFTAGQSSNPTYQSILKELGQATDAVYEVKNKIERYFI